MSKNLLSECTVCPRKCKVDRANGKTGYCGADEEIKIARAALHFWEEPCISGKSGSGTVFFSHCNMGCVFCQNYKISTLGEGRNITKNELYDTFMSLQEQGANNINLVTPTHYIPQIVDVLKYAKNNGLKIPVLYNSGGYENPDALRLLEGLIDIYLPDMKYFSDKYAILYSNAPEYFKTAKAAISEMYRQVGKFVINKDGIMEKGLIVRHLLLPGLLFDSKKILDYLIKTYKDDIFISIMSQYTPMPQVCDIPKLCKKVDRKYYDTLINYAQNIGITNAFVQDEDAASESFIPEFFKD